MMSVVAALSFQVACVVSGIVYHDGRIRIGSQHPPNGGEDSYVVGWAQLGLEGIREYRFALAEMEVSSESHIQSAAIRQGVPTQETVYYHYYRGFPLLWISYFENAYGAQGLHQNVHPSQLKLYPKLRFGSILWWNLLIDLFICWCPCIIVICLPVWLRRRWRGSHDMCVNCGYRLALLTVSRCPECGESFDQKLLAEVGPEPGKVERNRIPVRARSESDGWGTEGSAGKTRDGV